MKSCVLLFLSLVVGLPVASFAAAQREEHVAIFDGRKVSVTVPSGFTYESGEDTAGLVNVNLATADGKVSVHLVFAPDSGGENSPARARKEHMVEFFNSYVAGSVEKAMRFEELEPRRGAGTYCVFTDASLVGRTELPPNEFLHLTAGVKTWPGVLVVFRLFSQDTSGKDYTAALRLLRDSVEERAVPLR